MGGKFWLGLLGGTLAIAILVAIGFLVFGAVWYAWGLGGAILGLVAILLIIGWMVDRRDKRRHEGLA
jgi:Flp pilus assembly protein TadB